MSTAPSTTPPIRWGVIGPGRIADLVVDDLAILDSGVLQAVASRSLDRARDFAVRHRAASPDGQATAHGSYAALLADPDVDAVYIATPHRQHHGIALAAIAAGKALLVEKAFTCTAAGAEQVIAAARDAGVFVMEAMWTRVQPAVLRARSLIADGVIGEVRAVHADLGLRAPFDAADRLWDPQQGGGALLDLGVYPVSFVQMVLGGRPSRIDVIGSTGPSGVDAEATVLWHGEGGAGGVAACSLRSPLPGRAAIFGTDGWIELPPRFHHATRLLVHRATEGRSVTETVEEDHPATGAGYAHELEEVHRCLAAGLTESPAMPLDDTLAVMEVLDAALGALGVDLDEDPSPL